jgi:hypothetical protein
MLNKENKTIVLLVILLCAGSALAAPGLDIRKNPVGPVTGPPWTGPTQDPCAQQGQWFTNGVAEFARPYEFYDNKQGSGGGSKSTQAIYGRVTSLTYGGNGDIVAFDITATIINDLAGTGSFRAGTNSHEENRPSGGRRPVETMCNTVMTADFAILDSNALPVAFTGPYRDRQPYIVATNEDLAAWYCWTPGLQQNDPNHYNDPNGDYYVPTWEFGNIAPGASSTRVLSFGVEDPFDPLGGIDPNDQRYTAIQSSYFSTDPNYADILLNRTTSLKISDWIDELLLDEGTAYPSDTTTPPDPLRNSDVSVFYVPEPATLSLLVLGAAALLRRRRSG